MRLLIERLLEAQHRSGSLEVVAGQLELVHRVYVLKGGRRGAENERGRLVQWTMPYLDMELDRGPLGALGHPQIEVLALADLKEDRTRAALFRHGVSPTGIVGRRGRKKSRRSAGKGSHATHLHIRDLIDDLSIILGVQLGLALAMWEELDHVHHQVPVAVCRATGAQDQDLLLVAKAGC